MYGRTDGWMDAHTHTDAHMHACMHTIHNNNIYCASIVLHSKNVLKHIVYFASKPQSTPVMYVKILRGSNAKK